MNISAGTLIVLRNEKIFLCHPTNAKWNSTYSPPKGGVDVGEKVIDAAIRETKEETSAIVTKDMISNRENPIEIEYKDKKGVAYKRVYLYRVDINSVKEIGLDSEVVPKNRLQAEEIDWAGFLDKKETEEKMFKRFEKIIELVWKN
jgi:ADP-ribose pyrophosphatase YjhB (NUDIX family)